MEFGLKRDRVEEVTPERKIRIFDKKGGDFIDYFIRFLISLRLNKFIIIYNFWKWCL